MSEAFVNKRNIMKGGEEFLNDTYSTTLASMNSAFGLATALAWNEAIKAVIQNIMPKGSNGHTQLVMYAVFVTVLYVVFMMLANKKQENVNVTVAKLA